MREALPIKRNIILLTVVLALAVAACGFLLLVRMVITGRALYGFLFWNLFLASVPYVVALAVFFSAHLMIGKRARPLVVSLLCFLWLVFYPNAPYLFTDFIYIFKRTFLWRAPEAVVGLEGLIWFDIVMSAAFAFIGHFIGLVSMYLVQSSLRVVAGRLVSWIAVLAALVLSGFGIYLGRFSRLNSWDIFFRPFHAFPEILTSLGDMKVLLFSAAFSFFIGVTYLMLYAFKRSEF